MAKKNYSKFPTYKQKNESQFNYAIEGRLPPQAIELEEAVLGAVMLENAINDIIGILKPESFYKDANCIIYKAILRLAHQSFPIDILTVTQELKKTGELESVGGAFHITQLTNRVASAASVEFHARIVAQKAIARDLIKASTETIEACYDEGSDCFDLLESASNKIFNINEISTKTDFESTAQLVKKALDDIEKNGNNADGITGIPSGIQSVDKLTGGWQKQNLIIIAGRPAMGKSAFVLSAANNAAFEFNKKTALFSLEMSKAELMRRLISSEMEINNRKLKSGKLEDYEWQQIHEKINKFYKENLFIDDTPSISVFELMAKARKLKEKKGIELIIVDYLQLMTADSSGYGNREQEISFISRSLKGLAKSLDIPVIALSQLSRSVETRGGGAKPKLSDLRESGAIEQDADMVGFLYRPSYYGIKDDGNGNTVADSDAYLLIEKHRDGPIDDAKFKFIGEFTKFVDCDYFTKQELPFSAIQPQRDFTEPNKNWAVQEDLPF